MAGVPLEGFRLTATRVFQSKLKKAADHLLEKMKEKAGWLDHTLDELEKMGHPYAIRAPHPPHEDAIVHHQTRRLYNNIKIRQVNQYAYDVGVDEAYVPYIRSVIFGTRFMMPRNFITATVVEEKNAVKDIFQEALEKSVE